MLTHLIKRELKNTLRKPQQIIQPIIFYSLTLCLFPLALGADKNSLQTITPAALWISLLLATLLATQTLFQEDYEDGTLSQDIIHIDPLSLGIASKISIAWLRFILPLYLIMPLFCLMFHIPLQKLPVLLLLLSLGSASLFFIGAIGAAITLSESQQNFLLFLIVLPFYFPALIIGVKATQDALIGLPSSGTSALLGALMLFSLLLSLPFTALALRAQNLP